MFAITNVEFIEYYSNIVPQDLLKTLLIGSRCSYQGKLILSLGAGKELKQEGPFLIPPIRWLESFSDSDEFIIECESSQLPTESTT
jgi:hypothetical protein